MQIITKPATPYTPEMEAFRKQAEELEGVFLNLLTKEMFATVESEEGLGGGSFGEETWRGMQAEELANVIAQNGGIGLADEMMMQLLTQQEANMGQTNPLSGIGAYKK